MNLGLELSSHVYGIEKGGLIPRFNQRNYSAGRIVGIRGLLFACLSLFCASVHAQVVGATLSGTITDPSGGVISGARIEVLDTATSVTEATVTDRSGFYAVPNLRPSTYQVKVTAQGFQSYVRSGITLSVGQEQQLNLKMTIGAATENVTVTGSAPNIELTSSTVEGLVVTRQMQELPMNARDWTTLATLEPGVVQANLQDPVGANALRANRGFGTQLSVSGTKPQLNDYRLDGISDVDALGGAPGSVVGIALGLNAISQFSVLTANASAAYGRTSGGVINASEKSGTNDFHGDVYWYLRNSAVDARDYFDVSAIKAPFHRSQFGVSLGGPIRSDKTFFFFNYEGFRQTLGTTNVNLVPSPSLRAGVIVNPDGTTTTVNVDPSVSAYMKLYPTTCQALLIVAAGAGNTCQNNIDTTTIGVDNFYTGRLDDQLSAKDALSATYYYDNGLEDSPDVLDNWIFANVSKSHLFGVEETHTFRPSVVNIIRTGYHRVYPLSGTTVGLVNSAANNLSLAAFPGFGPATYSVPGLTGAVGFDGSNRIQFVWNSYQLYDDAYWIKGRNSVRFGVSLERDKQDDQSYVFPNGSYTVDTLEDWLTNQPFFFRGTAPGGAPVIGMQQTIFGGYVQDDFKLRLNLTVNLGLRYEMSTVPGESHNELSNVVAVGVTNPSLLQQFSSTTVRLGAPYFQNPTYKNFEPRIGFAWDPKNDGKTALRGGFGIFDALPLNSAFSIGQNLAAPYAENLDAGNLPQGAFPRLGAQIAEATVGKIAASPTTVMPGLQYLALQQNPDRSYVMIYNLNVQRQLTRNTSLTVGYVGNHGVHMLEHEDDLNSTAPTLTPYGPLFPYPDGSGTEFSAAGQLFGAWWGGTQKYNALEIQIMKRFASRFLLQGSYTYGRAIDSGSATGIGDPFENSLSSITFFCPSCRYGLADYNVTHSLVVNYDWQLPSLRGAGAVGKYVLGGWELSGIVTAQSGMPMTPLIGGDPLGLKNADPWDFTNRIPGCKLTNSGNVNHYINTNCLALPKLPSSAPSSLQAQCTPFPGHPGTCSNLFGNAGRNSIVGPPFTEWDLSLLKNNYVRRISDGFNIQFQAQFFNVLNHPSFQPPTDNESIFDASGNPVSGAGAIDTMANTQREIQIGLNVIF